VVHTLPQVISLLHAERDGKVLRQLLKLAMALVWSAVHLNAAKLRLAPGSNRVQQHSPVQLRCPGDPQGGDQARFNLSWDRCFGKDDECCQFVAVSQILCSR